LILRISIHSKINLCTFIIFYHNVPNLQSLWQNSRKNEKNDFQDERCLWPWNVWQFNVNLVSRVFSASPKSSFFVLRFRIKRETDQFSIPFSRVKRILDSGRLLIRMSLNWIKIVFVFLILFFVFRDWSKCIHDWWGFKEWLSI
jgi:hypothetical protein